MKNEDKIVRAIPSIKTGLSDEEIKERQTLKLVNKAKRVIGRTYSQILFSDVFSFFNILMFAVAGVMIYAQHWIGLSFLALLIPNIIIRLCEDIKARRMMDKAFAVSQPIVKVIRNSEETEIEAKDIVLDDIVLLENRCKIPVDGQLLSGHLIVNESLLTGVIRRVVKNEGDYLYAGTKVSAGSGFMHADKIGEDTLAESIQQKAAKIEKPKSQVTRTVNIFTVVASCVTLTIVAGLVVVCIIKGNFATSDSSKETLMNISNATIAMLPVGIYLFASIALAISTSKVSKQGARVQDFYFLEMLARADVICVDKTGTITNGEMDFKKLLLYGPNGYSHSDVVQIVSNILLATKDNNLTAKALRKYFDYDLTKGVVEALPFNSVNKYSAATFKGEGTFVLGAAEYLNISEQNALKLRTEEYTSLGNMVLVLGKANEGIQDKVVVGEVTPIAIIVLKDHIRSDIIEAFKWFKENGVEIKVISGDDTSAVSQIATEAGIEGGDRAINLTRFSNDDVAAIASVYTVFGRATPEQKQILVQSLKKEGKIVAMIGDGVNDVLALKAADCSIAMDEGVNSAENVAQIVLENSKFNVIQDIASEGSRVVNNVQRTSSLFMTKTIFAVTTTTIFLVLMATIGMSFPFLGSHFQLWHLVNILFASMLLVIEPAGEKIKGRFSTNVAKKSIPGAITVLVAAGLPYLLYFLHINHYFHTGIDEIEIANTASIIIFNLLGLAVLARICMPFNKHRGLVFFGTTMLEIALLIGAGIVSYLVGVKESILSIDFPSLTLVNWFVISIIVVLSIAVYLIVSYVVETLKGEGKNAKN